MSFVKDRDAHTRGVNAVAAFDGTGRGPALQRLRARQMARRDRALSAVARGGLRSMGAIDAAKLGVTKGPRLVEGGNIESPTTGQVGGGRVPTPTTPGSGTSPGGMPYAYQAPPGPTMAKGILVLDPMVATPPRTPRQPPAGVPTRLTPPGTRPVGPLPPPSTPDVIPPRNIVVAPTGTSSGGGGGGYSSGGGGGGGSSADVYDDPGVATPTGPDSSSTLTTALLVGGGLLAAYLIFGKDDD